MTDRRYFEHDESGDQSAGEASAAEPDARITVTLRSGARKIPLVLTVISESEWLAKSPIAIDSDDLASMTQDGVPDGVKVTYDFSGELEAS